MTGENAVIEVIGLDHFVLRVRDLDASLNFYQRLLGLPILYLDEYRGGQRTFVSVRVGEQLVDLVPDASYDPDEGRDKGGFLHFCVQVRPGHLAATIPWLKRQGVRVFEEQPALRLGARGLGLSIYIADPDGYVVELKEHPA